nr:ATP synthase F0 subunit 8 [Dendostrea sandvichensis]
MILGLTVASLFLMTMVWAWSIHNDSSNIMADIEADLSCM